jgi:hypothetical protein
MKIVKTRRGEFVRMCIWATHWPTYDFPHLSLTRREAREALKKHIFKGKVTRAWVEWKKTSEIEPYKERKK